MNNKTLDEIEEKYTNPPVAEVIDGISYALVDLKNLEWLIEQAQWSLYLEEREKEIIDINQHETQYRQELESINMELNHQNKRYREVIEEIKKTSDDYRAGHLLDMQDSFFVDEIIAIINNLEGEE